MINCKSENCYHLNILATKFIIDIFIGSEYHLCGECFIKFYNYRRCERGELYPEYKEISKTELELMKITETYKYQEQSLFAGMPYIIERNFKHTGI